MKIREYLAAALPLAAAIVFAGTLPAYASAGSGSQWDEGGSGTYINAWDGGLAVNVYHGNAANNDFTLVSLGGADGLELTNGSFTGLCVGDYGNSQGDARAGLSACSDIPWGSKFTVFSCTVNGAQGLEFKDIHWSKWLEGSGGNGSPFYLNTGTATCFKIENPY